jgi:hypothetical protein
MSSARLSAPWEWHSENSVHIERKARNSCCVWALSGSLRTMLSLRTARDRPPRGVQCWFGATRTLPSQKTARMGDEGKAAGFLVWAGGFAL